MTEQRAAETPDGCPECGPGNPLADTYGHTAGMVPVPDDAGGGWRPCASCNRDRYDAWKAGTLVGAWTCESCGAVNKTGRIIPKGPGMKLECADCGAYSRFVGKKQLGLVRRSTRSRPEIPPSQRTRIILRDNRRCWGCGKGAGQVVLNVGHILSVKDGETQGVAEELLYSDANLITQCEECNLGLGKASLPLWLVVGLLRAHHQGGEADA